MIVEMQSQEAVANLRFRQISGTFGAEVQGIDLAAPCESRVIQELTSALSSYRVLLFRNQNGVTPEALSAFAANFGTPEAADHPTHDGYPGVPAVKVLISNSSDRRGRIVDSWHTDGATRENPEMITILQAVTVPEYGRDTAFADMVAAYEELSEPMKRFLEPLVGEHNWGAQKPGSPSVYHPLIYQDPFSPAKALYANRLYTCSIQGLRNDESEALLEFLKGQVRRPELQLRVQWEPGTIAMWNNALTQHYLVFDRLFERVMHRVMIYRDRP